MKVFLLFKDRDFDPTVPLPQGADTLVQDLELDKLFEVMAAGDKYLLPVARQVMLSSLTAPDEIRYRQEILKESIAHEEVIREIYDLVVETLVGINKVSFLGLGFFSKDNPELTLHRAVQQLRYLSEMLKRLWELGNKHSKSFSSEGFSRFFGVLDEELDGEYFERIKEHLEQLSFRDGVLISAELGEGHKGANYTIRSINEQKASWIRRMASQLLGRSPNTVVVPDRDEPGLRALEELRGRGINSAANAVARASDHVLAFFTNMRYELAFYVSCLNLRLALTGKGEPICFPDPLPPGHPVLEATDLYDASLSLRLGARCVGNSINSNGKALVFITGANRGGKSTFIRSVGQAQLMMQAGMFVAASEFQADVRSGVFTHFKREEDKKMESGKLEEELARMSEIVDQVSSGAMVIFNESFASTNEREGSEIGRNLVRAMLDSGIKVFFVTHFFDLASSFLKSERYPALFMRANREDDGRRSFKLIEGEPLPTVYGVDIYREVFGCDPLG